MVRSTSRRAWRAARAPLTALALTTVLTGGAVPPEATVEDAQPEPAPSTWSVAPASAEGPDGRPRFEYVVEPGHRYDDHVAVRNVGTEPLQLEVYAADAASGEIDAFTVLAADEPSREVGTWVDLPSQQVEVPPRDVVLIPFSMTIPVDVEPGDYAGGVVAVMHTDGAGDAAGIDVQTRVGTRVYVRVAGPVEPALSVETVTATYAHAVNPARPGHGVVGYTVVNTGNVRLDAVPVASVSAPFEVWDGSAEGPGTVDLFPGMAVSGSVELPVAALGPMSVEVVVEPTSSAGQQITVDPAAGRTTLWAVPWSGLVALALVLLVVGSAVQARRRVRRLNADAPAPRS
ncbi:hypothetical protein N869_01730 [Cellulomonas bogoriensis 69B4 = DSM 16987]|uniref:DUF916 domain-containing protein n=1 Tax=Cellulomonas bogoriensis 69B4 = DSM 16987 TaxID=1386082 RepID=A0A0A0BN52_9CELL|nr:hypothetical protein N869_01730 [Cellulomonas bogoriensis 69B4 = DSM 16987]